MIERKLISLSTLAFIWSSLSVFMLASAILFLNWHFACIDESNKKKSTHDEGKIKIKFLSIDDFFFF